MVREEYRYLTETAENCEAAMGRLHSLVEVLRKECPWDKVQTHESLRRCMLEEAYETVEAIDNHDVDNLREELGDVTLQVVFHASMEKEDNRFDLTDVINEECEKMIRRHPHVFLQSSEDKDVDKVVEKWENIKALEHRGQTSKERIAQVPKSLPALMRADKVLRKSEEYHLCETSSQMIMATLEKTVEKVKAAGTDHSEREACLGELLLNAVALANYWQIDAERTLEKATADFIKELREPFE